MVKDSPLASVTERAAAIHKVIKEVRRLNTEQQVKDALSTRNKPNTEQLLRFLL